MLSSGWTLFQPHSVGLPCVQHTRAASAVGQIKKSQRVLCDESEWFELRANVPPYLESPCSIHGRGAEIETPNAMPQNLPRPLPDEHDDWKMRCLKKMRHMI